MIKILTIFMRIISIYAYDKDINHIYENQLKEAKPRLERYIHIYYDFIR